MRAPSQGSVNVKRNQELTQGLHSITPRQQQQQLQKPYPSLHMPPAVSSASIGGVPLSSLHSPSASSLPSSSPSTSAALFDQSGGSMAGTSAAYAYQRAQQAAYLQQQQQVMFQQQNQQQQAKIQNLQRLMMASAQSNPALIPPSQNAAELRRQRQMSSGSRQLATAPPLMGYSSPAATVANHSRINSAQSLPESILSASDQPGTPQFSAFSGLPSQGPSSISGNVQTHSALGLSRLMQPPAPVNGPAILRLLQYADALGAGPSRTELHYWRTLVANFYLPTATLKFSLCKQTLEERRSFGLPSNILPRYFHAAYLTGLRSTQLILHTIRETYGSSSSLSSTAPHHLIEAQRASWVYNYANGTQVITTGILRAAFLPVRGVLKIELLEFEGDTTVEYVARAAICKTPQPLVAESAPEAEEDLKPNPESEKLVIPESVVNEYGVGVSSMRYLELSDSLLKMKDLISFSLQEKMGPKAALQSLAARYRSNPSSPSDSTNHISPQSVTHSINSQQQQNSIQADALRQWQSQQQEQHNLELAARKQQVMNETASGIRIKPPRRIEIPSLQDDVVLQDTLRRLSESAARAESAVSNFNGLKPHDGVKPRSISLANSISTTSSKSSAGAQSSKSLKRKAPTSDSESMESDLGRKLNKKQSKLDLRSTVTKGRPKSSAVKGKKNTRSQTVNDIDTSSIASSSKLPDPSKVNKSACIKEQSPTLDLIPIPRLDSPLSSPDRLSAEAENSQLDVQDEQPSSYQDQSRTVEHGKENVEEDEDDEENPLLHPDTANVQAFSEKVHAFLNEKHALEETSALVPDSASVEAFSENIHAFMNDMTDTFSFSDSEDGDLFGVGGQLHDSPKPGPDEETFENSENSKEEPDS